MTTPNQPPQTKGHIGLLLKAEQALRSPGLHKEHIEAAVDQAFQAMNENPGAVSSNQVAALFSYKIHISELAKDSFDSYNAVIEFGKALIEKHKLWPSTKAYIYSELARCCAALIASSNSREARSGYHRALLKYVKDAGQELTTLKPTALARNKLTLEVLATSTIFSAVLIEPQVTPKDVHGSFWTALTNLAALSKSARSRNSSGLLELARMLVCRETQNNTSDLRNTWREKLARFTQYVIGRPFRGALQVVIVGYQHLAVLSHLAKDNPGRAAASLGIAKALENYPAHADMHDNYLSLAYESLMTTGGTREAERILERCRQINVQRRFNGTARLRLFAARGELDTEPEHLLSQGAVYADLFRSVTTPTKESNEVSFRVAKVLFVKNPDTIIKKIREVYDLCSGNFQYRAALSFSVQLLLTSFARDNVMTPFMSKLAPLRPVLPTTHQSLIAVIAIRQLLRSNETENAIAVTKIELRSSPRGEENYLREDIHCLAAIARIKVGKWLIASYHLRMISEKQSLGSDGSLKKKLLRQSLEFFCAIRQGQMETAAACWSCFVVDYRPVKEIGLFSDQQLKSPDAFAMAIQEYLDRNILYEVFDGCHFKYS